MNIFFSTDARLSATEYLQEWGAKLFPSYFDSLLHPFFCSVLPMDPDRRILAIEKEFPLLVKTILGPAAQTFLDSMPARADKPGLQLSHPFRICTSAPSKSQSFSPTNELPRISLPCQFTQANSDKQG